MAARYQKTTFIEGYHTSNLTKKISQKNTVLTPGINWD
jgi:hypothetical protein